jgi:hypothetical protein
MVSSHTTVVVAVDLLLRIAARLIGIGRIHRHHAITEGALPHVGTEIRAGMIVIWTTEVTVVDMTADTIADMTVKIDMIAQRAATIVDTAEDTIVGMSVVTIESTIVVMATTIVRGTVVDPLQDVQERSIGKWQALDLV